MKMMRKLFANLLERFGGMSLQVCCFGFCYEPEIPEELINN
jgi:cyclic lactone autoinducer peptide